MQFPGPLRDPVSGLCKALFKVLLKHRFAALMYRWLRGVLSGALMISSKWIQVRISWLFYWRKFCRTSDLNVVSNLNFPAEIMQSLQRSFESVDSVQARPLLLSPLGLGRKVYISLHCPCLKPEPHKRQHSKSGHQQHKYGPYCASLR